MTMTGCLFAPMIAPLGAALKADMYNWLISTNPMLEPHMEWMWPTSGCQLLSGPLKGIVC